MGITINYKEEYFMRKKFNHLSFTQRLKLEALLKLKMSKKHIADNLGVHISTIYREIKRGLCDKKISYQGYIEKEYKIKKVYSPETAEYKYQDQLKDKGAPLKIGKDYDLANYIEKRIVDDGLTPLAVLGEIKANNLVFNTSISIHTLYSYIYKGVFLHLSMKHLLIKSKKKTTKNKRLSIARLPRGTSIEKRPIDISKRNSFGHWEMDCVCGPKHNSAVLLVLTERLTRKEIIIPMASQSSDNVVKSLNSLQRKYGSLFPNVFRSITVDNGSEFSNCQGMEKSVFGKKKRTTVYYCHPYCSSERGTNERMNREIRRIYPKGTDFNKISRSELLKTESWLNNYPRGILGYKTPESLFNYYVSNL